MGTTKVSSKKKGPKKKTARRPSARRVVPVSLTPPRRPWPTKATCFTASSAAVAEVAIGLASSASVPPPPKGPHHVAIVAMGTSAGSFLQLASSEGGIHAICDEVWTINATASTLKHDRAFVMNDIKHEITREAAEGKKVAQGILAWLPKHPGPVYTSTAYPEWPALVELPLADVLNAVGGLDYLNTSVAYAIGFAMLIGVKKLSLYGCDFTYPNLHISESGRGCVEYLLGIACARGMELNIPNTTTLMDGHVPPGKRLYGYVDPMQIENVNGKIVVTRGSSTPDSPTT